MFQSRDYIEQMDDIPQHDYRARHNDYSALHNEEGVETDEISRIAAPPFLHKERHKGRENAGWATAGDNGNNNL